MAIFYITMIQDQNIWNYLQFSTIFEEFSPRHEIKSQVSIYKIILVSLDQIGI